MIAGIDIGQRRDYAAVVRIVPTDGRDGHRRRWCAVQAEEVPLGTEYRQVAAYAAHLSDHGGAVVLDATGVGSPVLEHARQLAEPARGVLLGVSITAGRRARLDRWPDITVPKHALLDSLRTALERRQLQLPTDAHRLRGQLAALTTKPTRTGGARVEAAGAGHDDLALAACLATWTAALLDDEGTG